MLEKKATSGSILLEQNNWYYDMIVWLQPNYP